MTSKLPVKHIETASASSRDLREASTEETKMTHQADMTKLLRDAVRS